MSKKKFVIGTVCCIGVLSIGLGCANSYNIKQEKQEQIRIEKIKKEKEQERIKKEKEQERITREKEEKEKEELKRKQEEEEKRKAEEIKAAQEAERLAAEQAAQQAAQEVAEQVAQQAIVEENNVQENYVVEEEVVQNNEYAVAANTQSSVSYEDFMVMGVVYSNGYKYTYYSQSVLPGGGLNIPGRHVNGGFVRDGNGYIVLANDAPKGTIIETPFGTGMVYDRGTYGSHIDVYVQ